ncbi:MAG: hypothetical protein K8R44_03285 [Sulfurimonas sp.]|nr:hypothetical protein [Sulfurimonas sp.]
MYKLIIIVAILFSGCSQTVVTGVMCDQIAKDPKATIPCECRVYLEEKAAKASRSEIELLDVGDAIKFEDEEK